MSFMMVVDNKPLKPVYATISSNPKLANQIQTYYVQI
jgi:hypothetical protein